MRDDQRVTDWDGKPIEVGMTVIYGAPPSGEEPNYRVEIVEITDFDVDYNDDLMRAECYPPRVKVRFADGTEDTVSTHENITVRTWADYPDGPSILTFAADDLEVIA